MWNTISNVAQLLLLLYLTWRLRRAEGRGANLEQWVFKQGQDMAQINKRLDHPAKVVSITEAMKRREV